MSIEASECLVGLEGVEEEIVEGFEEGEGEHLEAGEEDQEVGVQISQMNRFIRLETFGILPTMVHCRSNLS